MGMSLTVLSREMGGSPGPSFLSRIESDTTAPTHIVTARLADALAIPREVLLNAAGHATGAQRQAAIEALFDFIGTPPPPVAAIPVLDEQGQQTGLLRTRMVRKKEERYAIADFSSPADEPFRGEALISLDRQPRDGAGVAAIVDGRLGAYTMKNGKLGNALGDKPKDPTILGVILRVVSEMDLEE
jgi:hypothetical protein